MTTAPCPRGCDHTDDEHRAFDDGLAAGERGDEERVPAWCEGAMAREGWRTGYSVGTSNREYDQRRRAEAAAS